METTKTRVAVAIPMTDTMPSRFFATFWNLYKYSTNRGYELEVFSSIHPVIDKNRNLICKDILEIDSRLPFDYVLWIDSDTLLPSYALDIMVKIKKDIIGGVVFSKVPPHQPNIRKIKDGEPKVFSDWKGKAIVEVDAMGFACVLHKMDVLRKMKEPYFRFTDDPVTSEDFYWCGQARKLGYQLWATASLNIGHGYSGLGFKEEHFNIYKDRIRER